MGALVLRLVFVVFLHFATAGPSQATEVESLRFWTAPDHTRLVFDVTGSVSHKVLLLDNPDRLVVDFSDARLTGALTQPTSAHPLIKGIRSAPRHRTDLRVVLDLKSPVQPKSFALPANETYGDRLVIDLYEPKKGRTKTAKPKKTNAGSYSRRRDFVVAIDAGHGGEDPGARGAGGTKEKDVVLAIAKRLAALIKNQPGMRAIMIRNGDYYVGLRQRMRIARKAKADVFVSVHADAFTQRHVRGSSVFTLSERGASSEAARWLAARENAADLVGGVSLDDKDDLLASVLLDLSITATREASQDVAKKVLRNLQGIGRLHQHDVQHAGFVVLKSPDIPSVLVETAFISNPAEEKNLRTKKHQARLAKAIFGGIRDYWSVRRPEGTQITAQKHVISEGDTLSAIAQRYGVSLRQLRVHNALAGSRIRIGQVLKIPYGS